MDVKAMMMTLESLEIAQKKLDFMEVSSIDSDNTAIVVIDVLNGFLKKGNLSSDRVCKIAGNIVALLEKADQWQQVFLCDCHPSDAVEFEAYPTHCLEGEWESEVVDELKPFMTEDTVMIAKNSTNGFLTHDFMVWLQEHQSIDNFVVVGDCTDICVKQFALTLKAYFNENNESSRIIVPMDCVETYDLEATNHNADLMNLIAFYEMQMNGIELVRYMI